MPEVDAFIGLDQITKVAPIIENLLGKKNAPRSRTEGPPPPKTRATSSRSSRNTSRTTTRRASASRPKHFAYVKIAEGCNHPCTFCIIPKIRGQHRSPHAGVASSGKSRRSSKAGVKEINLISPGHHLLRHGPVGRPAPEPALAASIPPAANRSATLLRELNKIEGDFWIRLLYTHPAHWSDELIQTIAECDKVARYVDIPLQHIQRPHARPP